MVNNKPREVAINDSSCYYSRNRISIKDLANIKVNKKVIQYFYLLFWIWSNG